MAYKSKDHVLLNDRHPGFDRKYGNRNSSVLLYTARETKKRPALKIIQPEVPEEAIPEPAGHRFGVRVRSIRALNVNAFGDGRRAFEPTYIFDEGFASAEEAKTAAEQLESPFTEFLYVIRLGA